MGTVPLVPEFHLGNRRIIEAKPAEICTLFIRGTVDPAFASAIFLLGLALGSFLNVCIYRLPLHLSVVRPGSACPTCQKPIRFYDNVPILSWLILRGHCRSCNARISPRYLV